MNKINREVPDDLAVHIILDNLSTHKTPKVQRWLLRHRRFHLHFTPTYGSWMNLVERWFSALTNNKLQRSAHTSAAALAADIRAWIETWNQNPKPFVWHKTAEEILDRLAGYCRANHQRSLTYAALQPDRTLGGIVVSLLLGATLIRRAGEELGEAAQAAQTDPARTLALQRRLRTLNLLNLLVLFSVVWAMVVKPTV